MAKKSKKLLDCCKPVEPSTKRSGFFWGILYGLLPHTFCILFVIFSIIGATAGSTILRKYLFVPHLFQILVLISLIFASISAFVYLKRNNRLSVEGIKLSYKYLLVLYSTTMVINLLFIYLIIPGVANIGSGKVAKSEATSEVSSDVQVIRMDQLAGGYSPNSFTVKKGLPVRWIINSKKDSCAASIYSPKLGIKKLLDPGENIIEFTPKESGVYKFSCIMGMYGGTITVK